MRFLSAAKLKPLLISPLLLLAGCSAQLAGEATATPSQLAEPAPVADLVAEVDIPYEKFTLDNGLTVLVHEDRNTPVVAVSVWYGVGSKNEPKDKTGYAHLFEHIMFNGSENAPDDYFVYLKQIGATGYNGTTWFDRTNYYETVPRASLESALFLESDRMGNLLGAVTQAKLDNQIAVVQNEKRQGDNQPYGLYDYAQVKMLFPPEHPYGHLTIGSMEQLSAASLQDMHDWFRNHYAPNNAVVALSGDMDAAEARPLMEKWFGRFSSGPEVAKLDPPVPTLPAREKKVIYDQIPTERITYSWAVPGLNDPDNIPLAIGADVLGGLLSSRLDNILVRQEQLAVSVSAWVQSFLLASIFEVTVDVKEGVDADMVSQRLDAIIKDFIANGPTEDEVRRVATDTVANRISGLEYQSGMASELASGELYSDDPGFYKKWLERVADISPAEVRDAMQKWLTRPVAEIRVVPGERGDGPAGERLAGSGEPSAVQPTGRFSSPAYYDGEGAAADVPEGDGAASDDLSVFPPAGEAVDLDLPDVEKLTLDNGVPVYFARREGVPLVRVVASFDGGYSSDSKGGEGTAAFATRVMQEGTTSRDSTALAEEQERLGASLSASSSLEESEFSLRVVSPNLAPALELLSDMVRNPAFDPNEIERVRAQQLARIKSEYSTPTSIAFRALPPIIYGEDSRYGVPFTGTGYADVVEKLDQADLREFQARWIRPDNMKLFVIGDTDADEVLPLLNRYFGDWATPAGAPGILAEDSAQPRKPARIIVYDRPQSPQSYIVAGEVLPFKGTEEMSSIKLANDVLGGDFLSRINMDLREDKGWSYGARSTILRPKGLVPFIAYAPVQADQTGPALKVLRDLIGGIAGDQPISTAERDRVVKAAILELPGQYETSLSVLGQMQNDEKYGHPFDYAEGAAARYRALSADDLNAAFAPLVKMDELVWIVVGDADIIRPQLADIDLPVEYREAMQ